MNWEHRHEQYNRCALACNDLVFAANIAEHILSQKLYDTGLPDRMMERLALTTALVVTYARPFTTARGFVPLPSGVTRVLSPEQRQRHQEVLALRDEVYAHTDRQHFWATVEISEGAAQAVTGVPRALMYGLGQEVVADLLQVIDKLKSELLRRQVDFEGHLMDGDPPNPPL